MTASSDKKLTDDELRAMADIKNASLFLIESGWEDIEVVIFISSVLLKERKGGDSNGLI